MIQTRRALMLVAALLSCACDARVTTLATWRPNATDAGASATEDAGAELEPGVYIEAEAGELSAGFRVQSDSAASAGQYLAPPDTARSESEPGSARAGYRFELTRTATYRIWGRIRGPDADHNRLWFQLDGGDWYKWRISTGDIWYWDGLHDDTDYGHPLAFPLTAGQHTLLFANCVDGVGLDRLYVTAAGDMPAGNDTTCLPPHSIERAGQCDASCGSHGKTHCGEVACQGRPVIVSYDCAVCCLSEP